MYRREEISLHAAIHNVKLRWDQVGRLAHLVMKSLSNAKGRFSHLLGDAKKSNEKKQNQPQLANAFTSEESFSMVSNVSVAVITALEHTLLSDDELVAAVMAGEEEAFAELFTRHKRLVANIAGRFFPRREQIEEVIQMSFYQAYLALRQYQGGQTHSFAAWLKRITVNTCLDELRKSQRRPENLQSDLSESDAASFLDARWDMPSAERRTIARDLANKLLARLEPEDRLALTLLYEDEWSMAEIGELLGWSISKVKGRAHKARQHLQRAMKRFR